MSLHSFDDLEELFAHMRRDQENADSQVQDWQASVKPGEYVCRKGPGFLIYSEILYDAEPREPTLRNYRFTRSYSIACPSGELGDIHVSTIERKLSKEDFQAARENGWHPPSPKHFQPNDPTEAIRRQRLGEINAHPGSREALQVQYGQVWSTEELRRDFAVLGFMAPYCVVIRKADGVQGSVEFQHHPRYYFSFQPE